MPKKPTPLWRGICRRPHWRIAGRSDDHSLSISLLRLTIYISLSDLYSLCFEDMLSLAPSLPIVELPLVASFRPRFHPWSFGRSMCFSFWQSTCHFLQPASCETAVAPRLSYTLPPQSLPRYRHPTVHTSQLATSTIYSYFRSGPIKRP